MTASYDRWCHTLASGRPKHTAPISLPRPSAPSMPNCALARPTAQSLLPKTMSLSAIHLKIMRSLFIFYCIGLCTFMVWALSYKNSHRLNKKKTGTGRSLQKANRMKEEHREGQLWEKTYPIEFNHHYPSVHGCQMYMTRTIRPEIVHGSSDTRDHITLCLPSCVMVQVSGILVQEEFS